MYDETFYRASFNMKKKLNYISNHKTINPQQIRVHQQIINNTHSQEYTKISKINDKVNYMFDQLYIHKTINLSIT